MHEELENFERNQVWELVESPPNCHPIGTNWVWKNKEGENGMVVRPSPDLLLRGLLTVKIRQPSHDFTFGVGISFIPYPLVLTPVV
jgi:hypothetical protein